MGVEVTYPRRQPTGQVSRTSPNYAGGGTVSCITASLITMIEVAPHQPSRIAHRHRARKGVSQQRWRLTRSEVIHIRDPPHPFHTMFHSTKPPPVMHAPAPAPAPRRWVGEIFFNFHQPGSVACRGQAVAPWVSLPSHLPRPKD